MSTHLTNKNKNPLIWEPPQSENHDARDQNFDEAMQMHIYSFIVYLED